MYKLYQNINFKFFLNQWKTIYKKERNIIYAKIIYEEKVIYNLYNIISSFYLYITLILNI